MKKNLKRILLGFLIFLLIAIGYFFIGSPPQAKEISWGVNFSQKHAENLGLNWQETYSALIEDLGAKNIKLATYWDLIESEEDKYDFEDLDWQIKEAEKREAKILLVIGMKTPRWPECHLPQWAKNKNKEEQQEKILNLIEKIVLRYRERVSVWAWQVENEPFFPFGECPKIEKVFLKEEINLVKSLDNQKRPIVISDSGEGSFWITAAKLGDIVATTLHRKVWFKEFKTYVSYPFSSVYYWRRAQIIENFFGKEVFVGELQTEPWCPTLLYDCPLEEQRKTMDLTQFQKNIQFAKETGLKEFYLWGGEWMYWLKEKGEQPEIWQEAKKLFIQ